MDILIPSLTAAEAETVRRLTEQVVAGHDLALYVEDAAGRARVDHLADGLANVRSRVLRVSAQQPGGLSLSGVMAQVTGETDLAAQDDRVLELGYAALTRVDSACDRIVLLVTDAHALDRTALRYIQFAARSANDLRLVLAGRPGFLDASEFAQLRGRLALVPALGFAGEAAAMAPVAPPIPASTLQGAVVLHGVDKQASAAANAPVPGALRKDRGQRHDRRLWAVIGLGMAASVALGIVIGRSVLQPAPTLPGLMAALPPLTSPAPALGRVSTPPEPLVQFSAPAPADVDRSAGNGATPDGVPLVEDAPVSQALSVPKTEGPALTALPSRLPDPLGQPDLSVAALTPSLALPAVPAAAQPPATIPAVPEAAPKEADPASSQRSRKRVAPAASRATIRPRTVPARSAPEAGEDYVPSLSDPLPSVWRSPTLEAEPSANRPQAYIGTYTSGGNGVRTFRFGP